MLAAARIAYRNTMISYAEETTTAERYCIVLQKMQEKWYEELPSLVNSHEILSFRDNATTSRFENCIPKATQITIRSTSLSPDS